MTDPLATAIERAETLARDLINEYVGWRSKITYGSEMHAMYMEHYSKPHVIEKKKSARVASNASS